MFAEFPAGAAETAKQHTHDDGDDDGDVATLGELANPAIAMELNTFIEKLSSPGQWVGISAFTLFALAFRRPVQIWIGAEKHNVFHYGGHTYWEPTLTDTYIPQHAQYHAIACEIQKKVMEPNSVSFGIIQVCR